MTLTDESMTPAHVAIIVALEAYVQKLNEVIEAVNAITAPPPVVHAETPSVPEAEPPEQEQKGLPLSFDKAITEYGYRVMRHAMSPNVYETLRWQKAMETSRQDLIAATLLEYAQPGKGV